MIRRLQKLHRHHSLFLFGPRGAGKSTLLRQTFADNTWIWIDLLKAEDDERFGRDPDQLSHVISQHKPKRVIIDEVQKQPKLLDIVHREIENNPNIQFILTGSSARKLKRHSANLLAGRAFEYFLFPLTSFELGPQFDLSSALRFGTLPKLLHLSTEADKMEFLRTYSRTYLKEEVLQEQIIRNAEPFQDFLEIAAQMNGKIINFSKIARDVGTDDKTIKSYFSILSDTYLGFFHRPFHRSIRKRQRETSKFYFFDLGIKNALDRTLKIEPVPGTYAFGDAFEAWVTLETYRLNEYKKSDFKISYLRTYDDTEVDMIIERPGEPDLLIEVKSSTFIRGEDLSQLASFFHDWDRKCVAQVWSLDPNEKKIDGIVCLPWQTGLRRLFQV